MVFLNRETGKTQVFSADIPDLGYIPTTALSQLVSHYSDPNNRRTKSLQLNSTFDIAGTMSQTEFPFVTSYKALLTAAEEVRRAEASNTFFYYFGGEVIVDDVGIVRMSVSNGYAFYRNQSLTLEFNRNIMLPSEILTICDNFTVLPEIKPAMMLNSLKENHTRYLGNKDAIISLGVKHIKGGFFAAWENIVASGPRIFLLVVKPHASMQIVVLTQKDIQGIAELKGISI